MTRDLLRSLTLGAPARQFRKKLVTLRDASRPKVEEVERDEEGAPVMEPVLDAKRRPMFDDSGAPLMRERKRYRHPPMLDAEGKPVQVEVREPGLKTRAAIFKAAGATQDGGEGLDLAVLQVETVIALTYEPGTNVRIYADADRAALLAQPAGSFVDDIFEVAGPLLNTDTEGAAEKN